MKQTWFLLPVLASASWLAVTSAQAQADNFKIGYNLHPYEGDRTAPPDAALGFTDPNVNLSNTNLGSGLSPVAPGNNQPQNDQGAYGVGATSAVYGTTAAASFTANEYLTFTLTPAAGQFVSLSQLQFAVSLPDRPALPALEYSTNGTTFTEMDPTSTTGSGINGTSANSTAQGTFNLSTVAALQNLTSGTTVTFDLLLYAPTPDNFAEGVYDDSLKNANGLDIEVDGTAIAPEPSTWAMMAAGAGLLLVVQRKRRLA